MALNNNFAPKQVFFCPELLTSEASKLVGQVISKVESFELSKPCFEKIAVREGSSGIYFLFKKKEELTFSCLDKLSENPLLLVLDGIEKPGNLGAILRTADACGVTAVILTGAQADFYNPHVIRTSLGAAFSVPSITASVDECAEFLKSKRAETFLSYLDKSSKPYQKSLFTQSCAIVVGSEAHGVSQKWLEKPHSKIIISRRAKLILSMPL